MTVADARRWIDTGFLLSSAERRRASGVYTPDHALAWRTTRHTHTVRPLLRADMTPQDAVQWHELGYTAMEAVDRHLAGERPRPRSRWRGILRARETGTVVEQASSKRPCSGPSADRPAPPARRGRPP